MLSLCTSPFARPLPSPALVKRVGRMGGDDDDNNSREEGAPIVTSMSPTDAVANALPMTAPSSPSVDNARTRAGLQW
jgi:hypothetical protein